MRIYLPILLISLLTGCASTSSSNQHREALPSPLKVATPVWKVDSEQMPPQAQQWLEMLREYDVADNKTVKQPYEQAMAQLEQWPQNEYCSQAHRSVWERALEYNPTSLLAYSLIHLCAGRAEQPELQQSALEAVTQLSDILFSTGKGTVLTDPIMVRYPDEGRLLFQWAGYNVFDVELVRFSDQLIYKLHAFNSQSMLYSSFFVQDSQFAAYSTFESVPAGTDTAKLTEMLLNSKLAENAAPAQIWRYKQALLSGDAQWVVDELSQKSDLSPLETVLISQAAINLQDTALLDRYLDSIIGYSEQRFVDASAVLGQYLLSSGFEQETVDAGNLLRVNINDLGDFYATDSWVWHFLYKRDPKFMFSRLVDSLDDEAKLALYRQIASFKHYHWDIGEQGDQRLLVLLKTLAEAGQGDAQIDYTYVLLDGGFGQSANISAGIHYLKQLANDGVAQAQLELGVLLSKGDYGLEPSRDQALYWYRLAEQQGNKRAAYNLGLAYRYGTGVVKDVEKALAYFEQSFQSGFDLAGCRVADIYSEEEDFLDYDKAVARYQSIAEDEQSSEAARAACAFELAQLANYELKQTEQALYWWQQAGRFGESDAYFELGLYYSDYTDEPGHYEKAREYYSKAVRMGNYRAAANLGYMYEVGEGTAVDVAKALQYYRFSASGDSAQGVNNYATFLRYGTGVEQNVEQAMALYMKAFEMGNDYAAHNIADMYYFGELGTPDYQQACYYYEQAVRRNFSSALYDLGYCYFYGEGKEQNIEQGLKLLEKSSQSGDEDALNELGEIYFYGREVQKQADKALSYFKQAYQKKSFDAAYNLGLMYENGEGVQKDPVLSLVYYEQSANWGYVEGMLATAKAYILGFGTRKDLVKARQWLKSAIENGSKDAKTLLESL